MLQWIVESSLRLRFLIVVLALVLVGYGFTELRNMPVDVYPEFNPPIVEVQTEALGLSAAEVESLITTPMEADLLNGVAWVDRLTSKSVSGLSSVMLLFEEGTDPIAARQMVQERLTQAHALPNVSKPPVMIQPVSSSNRVMMISLASSELSLIDMSVLARWTMQPRLSGVPGVANVSVWGMRDQQLQIQVDPKTLNEKGVTLDQIIETSGEALWVSPLSYLESSSPGTAGWIDTPNQRLSIRHVLPILSPADLAKVPVVDETNILLGDVAQIVTDNQPLIGDAVLKSGAGLMLVVEKFPAANTLAVTKGIEDALENMRPGLKGIEIDSTIFRPASYIEQALANLNQTLLLMLALIAVTLLVLFFNWRLALISLLTIVISLMMAAYVLYLQGTTTLNMLVLTGLLLALVVVIDDAVVDVSHIAQQLRNPHNSHKSIMTIVIDSVLETRGSVFFATVIALLALMPLYYMGGITGSFLKPLVISYGWAIIVSLLVGMIVAHGLTLLLLDNRKAPAHYVSNSSPVISGLQKVYQGLVAVTNRQPIQAVVVAGAFILLALAALALTRTSLLPNLKQTDVLVQWNAAPGTSRTVMNRSISMAANELQSVPGVRNVGAHVGRAITGDKVTGIHSGEIWVSIDPNADHSATMSAINEVVNGYPGLLKTVQSYQPRLTTEALTGPAKDITVRVYGADLAILNEKALEVSDRIVKNVPGVVDVAAEIPIEQPQVEIAVNLDRAEKFQVKPGDVRRQASSLISGIQVGNLYEEQKVFDVVVWGKPEIRNSLTNLKNMLIDTPTGQVTLGEVADVTIVPAPATIQRDTVARYVDVTANVGSGTINGVTAAIKEEIKQVEMPFEHHAELLGESAARAAAQQRTLALIVAALVGAFLVMQAVSTRWSMALAMLLSLPMALSGGVLAALIGGGVLTLGSLFGFFALLTIAVRNAFVTIRHMNHLEYEEGESFDIKLVNKGSSDRFAPILITAITTFVALLPILFAGNSAGLEMVRPMAVVMLGGLITTTIYNLMVVPALYLRYGHVSEPEFVDRPIPSLQAAD